MSNKAIEKELLNLNRKIDRLNNQLKLLREKHSGNEMKFTYWGGWEMGYLVSRISEIENQIDFLNILNSA